MAAGAQVALLAPHPGRIRSMQVHQPGELLRVDMTVDKAAAADYDGLLVPGGYISPDSLRQLAAARELVRQMHGLGKPLAFLSQAPLLLVSSGLARQRVLTCWPGIRDDLVNAGAIWLNRPVVRDGHYLFGRSTQDVDAFMSDLAAFFGGEPASAPASVPALAVRAVGARHAEPRAAGRGRGRREPGTAEAQGARGRGSAGAGHGTHRWGRHGDTPAVKARRTTVFGA
jgi:protease I